MAGVTTVARAQTRDYGKNAPPVRYPDRDIVVLDKRFAKYKIGNTPIQRLYTGTLWAEGPAWSGGGRYLVWSDIPNDRQLRWLEEDGHVSVFRKPSGYSNGNTFDFEGRELSCEHDNRRVIRYENNGKTTVLADKWEGKPLNAPNDIVVHPDGGIWFTDPGYGSMVNYEGNKGELFLKEAVYRIDGRTAKIDIVTTEAVKPNGLCFSPDYKKLYLCDTGAPKNITVWDVIDGNKIGKGHEFAGMKQKMKDGSFAGGADGIRADVDGKRIGLWGGSYGGYLTAMGLARNSDLFAAGVDMHGVHDWPTDNWDGKNIPAELTKLAHDSSPVAAVDTWKSPVLFIHGDDDRNVYFTQTVDLVARLRARNVEIEQLIFPDEIHDFLLHKDWLAAYQTTADFFDRKLNGGKPPAETAVH